MTLKIVAIIPARYQSSRLPRKVLEDIHGRSMIQRVYEQATSCVELSEVIIATDHEDIVNHCMSFGGKCILTSNSHVSGTDRVAEVAKSIDADIIINLQADEPFIEKETISALIGLMQNEHVEIGTLSKVITSNTELFDYNCVKLTKSQNGKVLYFSRQAIPAFRDRAYAEWIKCAKYHQHIGIYGFKKATLTKLMECSSSTLEMAESLEQLRWLESGYSVYVTEVESKSFGIDTEEDLARARAIKA